MPDQRPPVMRDSSLDPLDDPALEAARPTYDRIAFLIQSFAGAAFARVAIMEGGEVWTTGVADGPAHLADGDGEFARLVCGGDKVLWIEDAARDSRLRRTSTDAAAIRFLAGAPVVLADGTRAGAVLMMDRKPRPFDAFLAARLEDFAGLVAEDRERRLARPAPGGGDKWAAALAASTAPIAMVMTDTDLRVMRASPRWLADRGFEEAEVVGRTLADLFPYERDVHGARLASALAGEPVRWDQAALTLRNGRKLWTRGEAAAWREADGAVGGLLLKSYDITDMVEAVEAARRSEQRLRLATDLAELRVWELDLRKDHMTAFGAPVARLADADGETETADDLWRGVHPEDAPAAKALWRRHVETGEPFRAAFRVVQAGHPPVWVAAAAEAVWAADGEIERIVGVLRDIDREKRAEQAMAEALAAAEAANRAKSEFLANMSHEIRTPLNGVMGVASALGRTDLAPAQREMVELIGASAHTLETLLSDVLDLARLESGRLELRNEVFDLAESLRLVSGLFEARARAKGLAFKATISPAARTQVCGDVVRLRQIVSNLLSNAVKFTVEGKVSLHVEAEPRDGRLRMRLSVIDTGIGFDEAVGQRLFRRFEQADSSATRRFGGAGLGLAISKSLADAMGGALTAMSTPGAGAVFTLELELPCAGDQRGGADGGAAAPPAPHSVAEGEARAMRILLAEDHPTNRKVVSLILGAVGTDLVCVENGAQAVETAASTRFDLILMDMQMPVMDGLSAISAIRAQERREGRAPTPILALTANATAEDIDSSIAAGANGHLTKPIAAETLIAAVQAARTAPDGDAGMAAPGAQRVSQAC